MPRPDFIPFYLRECGWPDTAAHSLALDQWALSEGMPTDWYNPLAMGAYYRFPGDNLSGCWVPPKLGDGSNNVDNVLRCPGYINSAKRFHYNMQRALYYQINAMFLGPGFSDDKATIADIYWAINRSPWCPKCQSGQYPVVMHNWLYGKGGGAFNPADTFTKIKDPTPVPTSLFTAWHQLERQFRYTIPHQIRIIENARREMIQAATRK